MLFKGSVGRLHYHFICYDGGLFQHQKNLLFVINIDCHYKIISYESTNSLLNYEQNEDSDLKIIILGGTYIVNSDRTKSETAQGSSLFENLFKSCSKLGGTSNVGAYPVGHIISES